MKIDWKSKIVDLLIVTVGITIAFNLNTWNESIKTASKARVYIESFEEENSQNERNLIAAIEYSESQKKRIDTLKQILLTQNYSNEKIKLLAIDLLSSAKFFPSIITMENVKASGDFELIKNVKLRKQIISTYNSFTRTSQVEGLKSAYVDNYVLPFYFVKMRFRDLSSLNSNYAQDPSFENIVFNYEVLLVQQIGSYRYNLEKIKQLNESLAADIKKNN